MICHKCYKYSHIKEKTGADKKQFCHNCGGEDHQAYDCINELECFNCGKGHIWRGIVIDKRKKEEINQRNAN